MCIVANPDRGKKRTGTLVNGSAACDSTRPDCRSMKQKASPAAGYLIARTGEDHSAVSAGMDGVSISRPVMQSRT